MNQSRFTRVLLPFVLIFFFLSISGFSQNKKDLEKKKEQLKKDIEFTNKQLEETRKIKSVSLNQLVMLNKKINTREELINTFSTEIHSLQYQIDETNGIVTALEKDVKKLKEEYARMICFAYKNRSAYTGFMFVFASRDFNQAYKRLRYLQQYSDYRKAQKELILKTQAVLVNKQKELEGKRTVKTALLHDQEDEKQTLSREKNEKVEVLGSLQRKEKELKDQLRQKQKAEEKLNNAIEDIIRRELEDARRRAVKEGRPSSEKGFALTPEAQKLSDDFAGNRGKLPWPVEQGVISESFGKHPHAVLKGIITNNNGVDISSGHGAVARAVFDGEVSGVVVIPGAYKAVIVRHGEYLSVYSNLEDVYVKMGQKVTTKQNLGTVHTDPEDSKTELHMEIWKGTVKMDPEDWLYTRK